MIADAAGQLAYSSVRFDRFTDAYGAAVSLNDADSLTGRLGISADYDSDWKDATGRISRAKFYGIANLYYDFLDGSKVDVSGVRVSQREPATLGWLPELGRRSIHCLRGGVRSYQPQGL